MTGQRYSPRVLGAPGKPDGTYGLGVAGGNVTGYEPVLTGLTSADGSVGIEANGDGTLNLAATGGGGGGAAALVGCGVSLSTPQSLTTGAHAFIGFTDADGWDTSSIHNPASNPSRFTIPTGNGGVWSFRAAVLFSGNSNGDRQLIFYVNGTATWWAQRTNANSASRTMTVALSAELNLAAGDYVELDTFNNFTGSLSVSSAVASAHFVG